MLTEIPVPFSDKMQVDPLNLAYILSTYAYTTSLAHFDFKGI